MAHTGRNYKLWFRRDAAWELQNYAFAYPEAYYCYSHGLISSSRYNVEVIGYENAINLNKGYRRIWTSAPSGNIFDNAYWQIETVSQPDEYFDRFRLSIWHSAIIDTPLFDATYKLNESSPVYYNFQGGAMLQLHYLSPDVNVDPDRFAPWIKAARWDRYPTAELP